MAQSNLYRIVFNEEKMMLIDKNGDYYENDIVDKFSEDDVIELNGDEVRLLYNGYERYGTIFITNHCNSGCIMCPDSDRYRSMKTDYDLDRKLEFVDLLPDSVEGLDITGGEPTLITYDLPRIIERIYEKKEQLSVMLLSNGRSFADKNYTELFRNFVGKGLYFEIPIHGSTAQLHDEITRANGGFVETIAGITNLLGIGISVGIRLVVTKMNYWDLINIVHLVHDEFPKVTYINIMGMECLGNAYSNCDRVWIEFNEIKEKVENLVEECIRFGIEPRLYNFPLCLFEEKYWGCYKKSITPEKVRYMEKCESCTYKEKCGGFFHSTINITEFEPKGRG